MKKQDILTPIGLVLATVLILFGISQGGTNINIFIDLPSLAITVGGSFAAVLIACSLDEIKEIPKSIKTSFTSNNINKVDLVDQFKELSRIVRKDGVLAIEEEVEQIEYPFLKKGLELVIDGIEVENTKEILEIELVTTEASYDRGSRLFKIWGAYAPAFGMVGTLIGLIQMLVEMGSPDMIASGMSKALITTFYGALLANTVLNPIGFNIESKGEKEAEFMEMMICGITSIQNGENSRTIEEKLLTYLSKKEKDAYYSRAEGEFINAT